MTRRQSRFVHTRPVRSVTEPWRMLTDGDGHIIHHAYLHGERVPGVEIISIEYQGPRYGLGYHYELRGAPELGRFKRSSECVYLAASINREVRDFLYEHQEPNAGYRPTPLGYFVR